MRTLLALVSAAGLILAGCSKEDESPNSGTETQTESGQGNSSDSQRGSATAQDSAGSTGSTPGTAPDNTARNVRDRNDATLTPEDQSGSEPDREITRMIRRSIVIEPGADEHSLSAKNIKIITVSGAVTLRGVVKSEQEKQDLERLARKVTGVTSVDNQLEVSP
jgi:osmotically-inducible protein OsmY